MRAVCGVQCAVCASDASWAIVQGVSRRMSSSLLENYFEFVIEPLGSGSASIIIDVHPRRRDTFRPFRLSPFRGKDRGARRTR